MFIISNSQRLFLSLCAGVILSFSSQSALSSDKMILRAGITHVDPDTSNDQKLKTTLGTLGAKEMDVGSNEQLGMAFSYPLGNSLAVELLVATPFDHDISVDGTDIGSTKHLPPTLSLTYDLPLGEDAPFTVYTGAGFNYTKFFEEEAKGLNLGKLELDDSFGLALQVGVDVPFTETIGFNASVRWIDINTDLKLGGADIGELEIDPWVYTLGIGYYFN